MRICLRPFLPRFSLLTAVTRSLKTSVADLKKGDWIEHEGKHLIVQSVTSAHSGRGARSFLVSTKEALSSQVVQIRPNPRDFFEKMEMKDSVCQFMYQSGEEYVLMDSKTLEEHTVSAKLIDGNLIRLLESGTQVKLRMSAEGKPIMVTSQPTVKCTVVDVTDSRESSDKKKTCVAIVQGGARITCSVQVQPGDAILVNVEDLSYGSRA